MDQISISLKHMRQYKSPQLHQLDSFELQQINNDLVPEQLFWQQMANQQNEQLIRMQN